MNFIDVDFCLILSDSEKKSPKQKNFSILSTAQEFPQKKSLLYEAQRKKFLSLSLSLSLHWKKINRLGIVIGGTPSVLKLNFDNDQLVVDERNEEGFRADESACALAKAGEQTQNSKCLGMDG